MPINLNPDDQLYKYKLINRIGSGGFGDVWLAFDATISKLMAVKILKPDVTIDERLKEAQIGNMLDHNNLVKMHYADVVQHNGESLVIIAMTYHENGSILKYVNPSNFIDLRLTMKLLVDVLRGLEYLHELHIFHSDIKPQNILVGNAEQGVITDYGISCMSPSDTPVNPRNAYKLHISPEVLGCNLIDNRTDIYQLGITAFRLFSGIGIIREKFNRLGEDEFNKKVVAGKLITKNDFPLFVPNEIRRIILKAIDIDPAKRFQSALEMRRAIEKISFPGYWSSNSSGELVGFFNGYEFSYSISHKSADKFDIVTTKEKTESSIQKTVGKYSKKNLSKTECEKLVKTLFEDVVYGRAK